MTACTASRSASARCRASWIRSRRRASSASSGRTRRASTEELRARSFQPRFRRSSTKSRQRGRAASSSRSRWAATRRAPRTGEPGNAPSRRWSQSSRSSGSRMRSAMVAQRRSTSRARSSSLGASGQLRHLGKGREIGLVEGRVAFLAQVTPVPAHEETAQVGADPDRGRPCSPMREGRGGSRRRAWPPRDDPGGAGCRRVRNPSPPAPTWPGDAGSAGRTEL